MKVYEIAELIDKAFPPAAAEEWDNIGLLVGRRDNEVSRVLLTLDVTPYVVEEAIKSGVQMIVSHHPMMFSGVKRITDEAAEGRMLLDLCRADIAVYAAHTNLDSGVGGLNDALAALFGLNNTEVVLQGSLDGAGLGRIGDLAEPVTALEFAQMAKKLLNTSVRLSGDKNKQVKRVAVGSGASDNIPLWQSRQHFQGRICVMMLHVSGRICVVISHVSGYDSIMKVGTINLQSFCFCK